MIHPRNLDQAVFHVSPRIRANSPANHSCPDNVFASAQRTRSRESLESPDTFKALTLLEHSLTSVGLRIEHLTKFWRNRQGVFITFGRMTDTCVSNCPVKSSWPADRTSITSSIAALARSYDALVATDNLPTHAVGRDRFSFRQYILVGESQPSFISILSNLSWWNSGEDGIILTTLIVSFTALCCVIVSYRPVELCCHQNLSLGSPKRWKY